MGFLQKTVLGGMIMNGTEIKELNKERLFLAIYNHKWLTARQLGEVGWPNQSEDSKRVSASRFIKQNIEDGYLLERSIKEVGGTIATLSRKGEKWMNDLGFSVMGGYKWGKLSEDGIWKPPSNYWHDFMANEFLTVELSRRMLEINQEKMDSHSYFVNLYENLVDYQHCNEREFRKTSEKTQTPDGVFWDQGQYDNYGDGCLPAYFIEVESYRKSGKKMNRMLYGCLTRAKEYETSIKVWRHPIEKANEHKSELMRFGEATTIFVYDINEKDERGYQLNHRQRIISGFQSKFEKFGWGAILDNKSYFSIVFAPFDSKTGRFLVWENYEFKIAS